MWMNDPNGMIYLNGCHHLFYQFHPDSMIWGPMHWGHATSCDLLTWENHNISLYPDKHGTIFSGCCVIDKENTCKLFDSSGENNLVAVYSYDTQLQGLATSIDNGMTWVKFKGNPILPAVKKNFRDPKVIWHALTGNWVMAISAERECQFYTSIIEVGKTGVGILIVEQNAKQALSIADRGYVLVNGKNSREGSGQDLLNNPEVRKSFLGG